MNAGQAVEVGSDMVSLVTAAIGYAFPDTNALTAKITAAITGAFKSPAQFVQIFKQHLNPQELNRVLTMIRTADRELSLLQPSNAAEAGFKSEMHTFLKRLGTLIEHVERPTVLSAVSVTWEYLLGYWGNSSKDIMRFFGEPLVNAFGALAGNNTKNAAYKARIDTFFSHIIDGNVPEGMNYLFEIISGKVNSDEMAPKPMPVTVTDWLAFLRKLADNLNHSDTNRAGSQILLSFLRNLMLEMPGLSQEGNALPLFNSHIKNGLDHAARNVHLTQEENLQEPTGENLARFRRGREAKRLAILKHFPRFESELPAITAGAGFVERVGFVKTVADLAIGESALNLGARGVGLSVDADDKLTGARRNKELERWISTLNADRNFYHAVSGADVRAAGLMVMHAYDNSLSFLGKIWDVIKNFFQQLFWGTETTEFRVYRQAKKAASGEYDSHPEGFVDALNGINAEIRVSPVARVMVEAGLGHMHTKAVARSPAEPIAAVSINVVTEADKALAATLTDLPIAEAMKVAFPSASPNLMAAVQQNIRTQFAGKKGVALGIAKALWSMVPGTEGLLGSGLGKIKSAVENSQAALKQMVPKTAQEMVFQEKFGTALQLMKSELSWLNGAGLGSLVAGQAVRGVQLARASHEDRLDTQKALAQNVYEALASLGNNDISTPEVQVRRSLFVAAFISQDIEAVTNYIYEALSEKITVESGEVKPAPANLGDWLMMGDKLVANGTSSEFKKAAFQQIIGLSGTVLDVVTDPNGSNLLGGVLKTALDKALQEEHAHYNEHASVRLLFNEEVVHTEALHRALVAKNVWVDSKLRMPTAASGVEARIAYVTQVVRESMVDPLLGLAKHAFDMDADPVTGTPRAPQIDVFYQQGNKVEMKKDPHFFASRETVAEVVAFLKDALSQRGVAVKLHDALVTDGKNELKHLVNGYVATDEAAAQFVKGLLILSTKANNWQSTDDLVTEALQRLSRSASVELKLLGDRLGILKAQYVAADQKLATLPQEFVKLGLSLEAFDLSAVVADYEFSLAGCDQLENNIRTMIESFEAAQQYIAARKQERAAAADYGKTQYKTLQVLQDTIWNAYHAYNAVLSQKYSPAFAKAVEDAYQVWGRLAELKAQWNKVDFNHLTPADRDQFARDCVSMREARDAAIQAMEREATLAPPVVPKTVAEKVTGVVAGVASVTKRAAQKCLGFLGLGGTTYVPAEAPVVVLAAEQLDLAVLALPTAIAPMQSHARTVSNSSVVSVESRPEGLEPGDSRRLSVSA